MHRRLDLFPQKSKPIFCVNRGLGTHRFEEDLYHGGRIGQKRLRDDEEGAEEERGEDYVELTKFRSRRSSRTTQANQ